MDIQTEITKKNINFISDVDLRVVLRDRLQELDRIFLVNANYSTIFLAISTIEGIFKHVATIFRNEIKSSPKYPKDNKGKRKEFDRLTINELYILLRELNVLPDIKNFENVYDLFRDYRNFIHPQAQTKKAWPTDLGHAQMAIGLLNATVSYLDRYIFIDKEIFEKFAGNPDYDSSKALHLILHNPPLHSFLVWNKPITDRLLLKFDLELPKDSVFNFVFNFANEGNFKMIRLDNRYGSKSGYLNCVLHCTQKYFWRERLIAEPKSPPDKSILPIEIEMDLKNKDFAFTVDSTSYSFNDKDTRKNRDLFDELKSGLRIGFFNEVGPVILSNIHFK